MVLFLKLCVIGVVLGFLLQHPVLFIWRLRTRGLMTSSAVLMLVCSMMAAVSAVGFSFWIIFSLLRTNVKLKNERQNTVNYYWEDAFFFVLLKKIE